MRHNRNKPEKSGKASELVHIFLTRKVSKKARKMGIFRPTKGGWNAAADGF